MAPRKRTYRRRRPTAYRRRRRMYRRGRNKVSTVKSRIMTGIPDKTLMKLKYVQSIRLDDIIGGVPQTYTYRANSINDPDFAFGGARVTGWNQWVNFYNRYRVNASKINVQILNFNTTTANSTVLVACSPNLDPGSSVQSPEQLTTLPYVRYRVMAPSSGGGNPRSIKNYISTKKMFGINQLDDLDFYSDFNSNPTREFFWNISANNITANTFSVVLLVNITYYVELSRRVTLPLST